MSSQWLDKAASAGYLAKGLIYAVIGGLAGMAAFGAGQGTDSEGAIHAIARQPFGRVLLLVLTAGLVAYVVWRLAQALFDPDKRGSGAKGLVVRVTLVGSALVYGSLAFTAGSIAVGTGSGGGRSRESYVAMVLGWPGGRWLIGIVALLILVKAGAEYRKAIKASFEEQWRPPASSRAGEWITSVSRVGIAARGTIFLLVAGFFLAAAVQSDPSEAKGLGGALTMLASQPFGRWLLGAMGAGLLCYAAYQAAQAKLRRIPDPV